MTGEYEPNEHERLPAEAGNGWLVRDEASLDPLDFQVCGWPVR